MFWKKKEGYVPDKPIRELFELIKSDYKPTTEVVEGSYATLIDKYICTVAGEVIVIIREYRPASDSPYTFQVSCRTSPEEFDWMTSREVRWLFNSLSAHELKKRHSKQKETRQKWVDKLCK